MSLERGRFGIEYKPVPRKRDSSAIGPVMLVVLGIAAISFVVTKVSGGKADKVEVPNVAEVERVETQKDASPPRPPEVAASPSSGPAEAQPPAIAATEGAADRPPKVRNLLLRLEEAEKMGNVEMAASTIESLRDLPGEPAADLDDTLARRLGQLNSRRLFANANRQWVTEVTVRPRENASRIAVAHGSTLSSLIRLNNLPDANHVVVGQKLRVMNHPRFNMTVHRRARYADLNLNGKFFNRYDIVSDAEIAPPGIHKTDANLRALFSSLGLKFSLRDRVELETLIPPNATIAITEM